MSSKIFYFSGTGNSLAVAREINSSLSQEGELVKMSSFKDEESIEIYDDIVGFVFPVYFLSVPDVVKSFIKKLTFKTSPYVFTVITCNGVPGATLTQFKDLLNKQHVDLVSGFIIEMPGNALVTPREVSEKRLSFYKSRCIEIAEVVNGKGSNKAKSSTLIKIISAGSLFKTLGKSLYLNPKNASCTSDCVGCGTCAKVCPLNNIKIVNHKPQWGENCANCLACFHWCPKKAVRGGRMLNKRDVYHHPQISVKDMY